MSKYQFTVEDKINLIVRMYQDHGYTVEEICSRLRYTEETVELIIRTQNLKHGEKSWRY
jgi:hypothetical protein